MPSPPTPPPLPSSPRATKDEGGHSSTAPAYGSKSYWQERYAKKEAHHSWYFSYTELRPILLPLLLGGTPPPVEEGDESDEEEGTEETDTAEQPSAKRARVETAADDHVNLNNADSVDCDADTEEDHDTEEGGEENGTESNDEDEWQVVVEEDCDDDDDDDDGSSVQMDRGDGLAKQGPVSVLEVGCGDVPLGVALAKDLQELQQTTALPSAAIVDTVVCIDYSTAVIERMREEHQQISTDPTSPTTAQRQSATRVDFRAMDARHLVEFTDASFGLIIDKGTLDAMISDTEQGVEHCIAIVAQCARVLTAPGYLVLVSHYNATQDKGLHWLQEVVHPALLRQREATFHIECHGHPDGGPAVYVIYKQVSEANKEEKEARTASPSAVSKDIGTSTAAANVEEEMMVIPIEFFSYG